MKDKRTNSFSLSDIDSAAYAYNNWQGTRSESIDEYLMRKRKIELNCLLKKIIANELNDKDKEIVKFHWFEGLSISETAKILNVDRSTISRRLDKINDIIYDKMKYAVEYRYGRDYSSSVAVIIKNKDALCLINEKNDSPGRRIRNLRMRQGFTLDDTGAMTGIAPKRIKAIENETEEISADDIKRIATAFRTTADYIVFGNN
jgi:transcriptional regulator with XRE-family HTH domain